MFSINKNCNNSVNKIDHMKIILLFFFVCLFANVIINFNLMSFSDFHVIFYRDQRYPGDGYGHPFPFMH